MKGFDAVGVSVGNRRAAVGASYVALVPDSDEVVNRVFLRGEQSLNVVKRHVIPERFVL
jgi:hypothetical protein